MPTNFFIWPEKKDFESSSCLLAWPYSLFPTGRLIVVGLLDQLYAVVLIVVKSVCSDCAQSYTPGLTVELHAFPPVLLVNMCYHSLSGYELVVLLAGLTQRSAT